MHDSQRYIEIQRDYEDLLAIKLVPQHIEALIEENHKKESMGEKDNAVLMNYSGGSCSSSASLSSNNYTHSIRLNGTTIESSTRKKQQIASPSPG